MGTFLSSCIKFLLFTLGDILAMTFWTWDALYCGRGATGNEPAHPGDLAVQVTAASEQGRGTGQCGSVGAFGSKTENEQVVSKTVMR